MVSEKWPGAFAVEKMDKKKQKSSLYNLSTLGSPGPLSSFHVKQSQSVVQAHSSARSVSTASYELQHPLSTAASFSGAKH